MGEEKRDLLQVLTAELEFLQRGGYRRHTWRPLFIFEDSPTCVNYRDRNRPLPCSECKLLRLVPDEHREASLPCRHIPLNEQGDTLELLYNTATQEELEGHVARWLRTTIANLRKETDGQQPNQPVAEEQGIGSAKAAP